MKKFTPYIFPLLVLGVVFLLVYRWYSLRTDRMEAGLLSEGVVIENLSEEQMAALTEVDDFQTAKMESTVEGAMGEVKYDVTEEKVTFTVAATLPESETARYQVWLKEVGSETTRHAFDLVAKKGGYVGSAALSAELLPLEVLVKDASVASELSTQPLLKGVMMRQKRKSKLLLDAHAECAKLEKTGVSSGVQ